MFDNITKEELKEALKNSSSKDCFLDVRNPNEWEELKIPEFTHYIPLGELSLRLNEIWEYDNVYVMCKRGGRSITACNIIAEAGFTGEVYNVETGILGYMEENAK